MHYACESSFLSRTKYQRLEKKKTSITRQKGKYGTCCENDLRGVNETPAISYSHDTYQVTEFISEKQNDTGVGWEAQIPLGLSRNNKRRTLTNWHEDSLVSYFQSRRDCVVLVLYCAWRCFIISQQQYIECLRKWPHKLFWIFLHFSWH